jgi:ABC-type uncharacterized transport system permease subunit
MLYMIELITILCYLAGTATTALASFRRIKNIWLYSFGIPAFILHGYLLYQWIDLASGQNLTEFNLLSLAIWVTLLLILFLALRKQVTYLATLLFPLAAASILLAGHYPSHHIIQTANDPKQFTHILLSVITFSVLCMAGLQAVTLAVQEKFIRQKVWTISQHLPPIESMEKLLFQIITAGSILLACLLSTSIYFFHEIVLQQFLQKTILTFIALIVFISLLVGRYHFGWRGKKAIYWTLSGVVLISAVYFGSLLIMEFLP